MTGSKGGTAAFLGCVRNKFPSAYLRKGIPKYLSIQDAIQARSEFRDENKEISRDLGEVSINADPHRMKKLLQRASWALFHQIQIDINDTQGAAS